ncbi:DUF4192 domain-containing protein [Blastococcus sp. SYSU D00695]
MAELPHPPVRVSGPGEVAAALPALLGFAPQESVVLVALGGPGGERVGMVARADLPAGDTAVGTAGDGAGGTARRMAAEVLDRVAGSGATGVLVVVVSEAPDVLERAVPRGGDVPGLPHRDLAGALVAAADAQAVPVREVLLVRAGRWWSYDCPRSCCAPGAGTPLPVGVSPVEAAAVAGGAVVERARSALADRIAPPSADARRACASAVWEAAGSPHGWEAVTAALRRCAPGRTGGLPDPDVAAVVWALNDRDLRDRALGCALGEDAAAAETLWTECTRRAPAPLDAAPATLLAVSAWLRGDGAMANVALDRALTSRPGYSLALLLAEALSRALSPADLRLVVSEVAGRAG